MEPPQWHNCPANITKDTNPGSNEAWVQWEEPTASDNSGLEPAVQRQGGPGFFPIGETEVVYEAMDASGNIARCAFFVVVLGESANCHRAFR